MDSSSKSVSKCERKAETGEKPKEQKKARLWRKCKEKGWLHKFSSRDRIGWRE